MINIWIVGTVRGFFNHLIKENNDVIMFSGENKTYEIANSSKNILSDMLRTKIVGFGGFFKSVNVCDINNNAEYLLSYNRFLKLNKKYIVYLENPTA